MGLRSLSFGSKVWYKPSTIILDITTKCNLQCKHCDLWKNSGGKELTLEQWKDVLSRLSYWLGTPQLGFCGGEPLLRKDLIDILRFAQQNGILTSIVSNGFLMNEKKVREILEAGVFRINISLDGHCSETHDYLRGVAGTYYKAVSAIKYLKRIKAELKADTRIGINTVLMGPNLKTEVYL